MLGFDIDPERDVEPRHPHVVHVAECDFKVFVVEISAFVEVVTAQNGDEQMIHQSLGFGQVTRLRNIVNLGEVDHFVGDRTCLHGSNRTRRI